MTKKSFMTGYSKVRVTSSISSERQYAAALCRAGGFQFFEMSGPDGALGPVQCVAIGKILPGAWSK